MMVSLVADETTIAQSFGRLHLKAAFASLFFILSTNPKTHLHTQRRLKWRCLLGTQPIGLAKNYYGVFGLFAMSWGSSRTLCDDA